MTSSQNTWAGTSTGASMTQVTGSGRQRLPQGRHLGAEGARRACDSVPEGEAKALRLLDPDIVLILWEQDGTASWDHTVLQACMPVIDMHSMPIYTVARSPHLKNVTAPLAAERAIRITVWLNVFVR
ncbi:hypothetical protein F5B22DRAFT_646015 [Xylaria bambusicola]|uniref:uncharacterized protein n=1 Tax=Xylaria bambusicola TaxID=326684 RepID=UPI002007A681|nr:uncharacterized protein F5B22DRAFT_646015 [Xylaria bambusicola]KAI0517377.1 hypothetical protein F5B22DRAFT_646015 [Xylaria bambusicola]